MERKIKKETKGCLGGVPPGVSKVSNLLNPTPLVQEDAAPDSNFVFGLIVWTISLLLPTAALAETIRWDGGCPTSNNWSCAENWDLKRVPTSLDDVIFDKTSAKSSTIDSLFAGTINSLTLDPLFTGTITQASYLETLGSFDQRGGTFTGGTSRIKIGGDFIRSGGTFTSTSGLLKVWGNWISGPQAIFIHNLGFVALAGRSPCTVDVAGTETFQGLSFEKGDGLSCQISDSDQLVVNGLLKLYNGEARKGSGDPRIISRGHLEHDLRFDGGNVTIELASPTPRTIQLIRGGILPGLLLSSAATTLTTTGTGTLVFEEDVILREGSFYPGTGPMVFQGDLRLDGASVNPSQSTADYTITGDLTQSGGTFTVGNGTIQLHGNFLRSGGTFQANSCSVILDGLNQAIGGSTTFFNLTKLSSDGSTLTFADGSTQIVQGTWRMEGSPGNPLRLRSKVPGTQWRIDPQGARQIAHLDVQDSENINAQPIEATGDSFVNSGNNTNWSFTVPEMTISDVTASEPESAATPFLFTVSLSRASTLPVSVTYQTTETHLDELGTIEGNAEAGIDYASVAPTVLTFAPGETSKAINVMVMGDSLDEWDEAFSVELTNPTSATLKDARGKATIQDTDPVPTISISDPEVSGAEVEDPNDARQRIPFTVSLSAPSGKVVEVRLTTRDGTTSANDYTLMTPDIQFAPGETSEVAQVQVWDELAHLGIHPVVEPIETFSVTLTASDPRTATVGDGEATASIEDNDDRVMNISDASVNEGDGTLSLTVTISRPSLFPVQAELDYLPGATAILGLDLGPFDPGVEFQPGETTKLVTARLLDDSIAEYDETIPVQLSNPFNTTLGRASATGTIRDNDTTATFSVSDARLVESDIGLATMEFVITLTGTRPPGTASVTYATRDGTATNQDYQGVNGQLDFGDGETEKRIPVSVIGDNFDEDDEAFTLTLSNPNVGTMSRAVAIGTIEDDDLPGLAIESSGGSTEVTEGGATDTVSFTLLGQPDYPVQISLLFPDDLRGDRDRLRFEPSDWNVPQTVTLRAVDDAIAEGRETLSVSFRINSSDPDYAELQVPPLDVTVIDNDQAGVSVVASGGGTEVTEGGIPDTYMVQLTSEPQGAVRISIESVDDLTVEPRNLVFTRLDWNEPQTVTVSAVDDPQAEGNETAVILHAAQSTDSSYDGIMVAPIAVEVIDNDQAGISVTESEGATQLTEGAGSDSYELVLTSQPTADVVVTLLHDDELVVQPEELIFTARNWDRPQSIDVSAANDDELEGPHAATIAHEVGSEDEGYDEISVASVVAQIADDDTQPRLTIDDVTVQETDEAGNAIFTVRLDIPVDQGDEACGNGICGEIELGACDADCELAGPVTVNYRTEGNSASPGLDFEPAEGTLIFSIGSRERNILIPVMGDNLDEALESFTLFLSDPVGARLTDAEGTGVILDDDDAPFINVAANALSIREGNGALVITVTLSAPSGLEIGGPITFGGTATVNEDYLPSALEILIPAGELTTQLTLQIVDDSLVESPETILLAWGTNSIGAALFDNDGLTPVSTANGCRVVATNFVTGEICGEITTSNGEFSLVAAGACAQDPDNASLTRLAIQATCGQLTLEKYYQRGFGADAPGAANGEVDVGNINLGATAAIELLRQELETRGWESIVRDSVSPVCYTTYLNRMVETATAPRGQAGWSIGYWRGLTRCFMREGVAPKDFGFRSYAQLYAHIRAGSITEDVLAEISRTAIAYCDADATDVAQAIHELRSVVPAVTSLAWDSVAQGSCSTKEVVPDEEVADSWVDTTELLDVDLLEDDEQREEIQELIGEAVEIVEENGGLGLNSTDEAQLLTGFVETIVSQELNPRLIDSLVEIAQVVSLETTEDSYRLGEALAILLNLMVDEIRDGAGNPAGSANDPAITVIQQYPEYASILQDTARQIRLRRDVTPSSLPEDSDSEEDADNGPTPGGIGSTTGPEEEVLGEDETQEDPNEEEDQDEDAD